MKIIAGMFLFASIFLAFLYIIKRIGNRISLSSVLFILLIVINGLGMLIYISFTGPDTGIYELALSKTISPDDTLSTVMFAVALMFWGLMLGSELGLKLTSKWSGAKRIQFMLGKKDSFTFVIHISKLQRKLIWGVVFGFLVIMLEQSQIINIWQYYSFSGGEFDKAQLRFSLGGTPYYLYNIMIQAVAPFLVMICWMDDVHQTKSYKPKFLTISLFIAVFVGQLATLMKAPPAIFILQLCFMFALTKNQKFNLVQLLKLITIGVLLFGLMAYVTYSELKPFDTLSYLYYRILDIPNEVLVEYFSAIPVSIPHTWGLSKLGMIFGDDPPGRQLETYFLVAEITRGSTLSSSNAMFIGDAWAQFSWIGITTISILVGFLVRAIDIEAYKAGWSDLYACITAGCLFGLFTLLSTSFTTSLVTGGLALVPMLALFFQKRYATNARS
ncbi:MAG: hypothetical protein V4536_01455 [Pseudomonadota bacterium]